MRYLCMSPAPPHVKARVRLRGRPNISQLSRQGTTNRIPNSVSTGKGDLMKGSIDAAVLKQVESEVRHIKAEYRGVVPEESIDLVAGESLESLADSGVAQLIPLFVRRSTRERRHRRTNAERSLAPGCT